MLALAFHVGPISINSYIRPNLKVQKKKKKTGSYVKWRAVIVKCCYIEVNKGCTFYTNFALMYDCFGPVIS